MENELYYFFLSIILPQTKLCHAVDTSHKAHVTNNNVDKN